MPTKIRIVQSDEEVSPRSGAKTWIPEVGDTTKGFFDHLREIGRSAAVIERIQNESCSILGACTRPTEQGRRTGLVLGRVQSGKTSSFTAVSALAHDNGFKLVIVIAGTTELLVEQTKDRLEADLRLTTPNAFQRWSECPISDSMKSKAEAARLALRARLKALCATGKPLFPGIPIVIVMKNSTHLSNLNKLLKEAADEDNLSVKSLPTLIIDDEAHMHSPNVGKDEGAQASVIYSQMRDLLSKFDSCSLLQYTATPQANLLMEIQSELSPEFIRLLEPGPKYVGGRELFGGGGKHHVRTVSASEYKPDSKPTDAAPKSLISAMANFLLTCAFDFKLKNTAQPHALLVHSDVKIAVHKVFEHWIRTALHGWELALANKLRGAALPQEFITEWTDLEKTLPIKSENIQQEEIRPILIQVLANLQLQTVNSKSDVGRVNFSQSPYWIINGGNILGVGYTIEGLVTTHMMRKPGSGMADTIQQRGRFFGYKGDQLNEIRLFITQEMANRFAEYAAHEDGLRRSLAPYDASNEHFSPELGSLKEWKRQFWLDPKMIPTRKKAQRLVLERAQIESDGWLPQRHMAPTLEADSANGQLVESLKLELRGDWRASQSWGSSNDPDSDSAHVDATMSTERLLELLANYTFSASDQGDMSTAILAIQEKHVADDTVTVIFMGGGSPKNGNSPHRRRRGVAPDGSVELFQGRGKSANTYVGDRKVHGATGITLQLHTLDLFRDSAKRATKIGDPPMRDGASFLAVRLSSESFAWAKNILQQR